MVKFSPIQLTFWVMCISIIIPSNKAVIWHAVFYENDDCTGEELANLTITDDGLHQTTATNATSVRVVGLWKFILRKSSGEFLTFLAEDAQPQNESCLSKDDMVKQPDFDDYHFISAEVFRDTSSLVLSTEPLFKGLRYRGSSLTENGTLIPRPMVMESIVLFDTRSWLIYPETNFRGTPKCVIPKHSSYDGYTIIKSSKEIVGSVKSAGLEGCDAVTSTTPRGGSVKNTIYFFLILFPILFAFY